MVRQLALTDIVPESEVMRMPMSVSSIYWGGEHYLDEKRGQLVLKVASKWSGSPDELPEYKEIRVELQTGKVVAGNEAGMFLAHDGASLWRCVIRAEHNRSQQRPVCRQA